MIIMVIAIMKFSRTKPPQSITAYLSKVTFVLLLTRSWGEKREGLADVISIVLVMHYLLIVKA